MPHRIKAVLKVKGGSNTVLVWCS